MAKVVVYTFASFPWLDKLQAMYGKDLVVLRKLTEDIHKVFSLIGADTVLVLGLAKAKRRSRWEVKTVNSWNQGRGLVVHGASDLYLLDRPGNTDFHANYKPGTTFCNWAAFWVKHYCQEHNFPAEVSFAHVASLADLIQMLNEMEKVSK